MKPDHIFELLGELWVVTELKAFDPMRLEVSLPQYLRYRVVIVDSHPPGQFPGTPVRRVLRFLLGDNSGNLVFHRRTYALLSRPARLIGQKRLTVNSGSFRL